MPQLTIRNNQPATEKSIAAVESRLKVSLPTCLKEFLLKRDGFQVYKKSDLKNAIWKYQHCMLTTDVAHIQQPLLVGRELNDSLESLHSIVGVTERLRPLFIMFAEEEADEDGVDRDPELLKDFICIGEKDDRFDEQFTYWMSARPEVTEVYCIELPLSGHYPLGYTYPSPIREQLEEPECDFNQFVRQMDVPEN